MAKLDAAQREKIPAKEFAEPKARKYPIEDRSHAANAKSRAKQALDSGRLSQGQYDKILSKANAKLNG